MLEHLSCRSQAVGVQGRHLYIAAGLTFVLSCYFLARHFYALQEVLTATVTPDPIPSIAAAEVVPVEASGLEVAETPPLPKGLPPLYSAYHDVELRLPQQDWTRTKPAPGEKFFFVAGHTRALGWGNAVQEHILNAYLAYKAGRSFVFGNFTWNDDGSLYSDYEGSGRIIPSQIPYSVLLRGPIVGESFTPGDDAPLAVSKDYFDHLCPKKVEFARQEVHANLTSPNSVAEITEKWASLLQNLDEPCVQSTLDSGPIYSHHDVWGVRTSLLDVWQDLKQSPFLTQFGWSPLVELAFDTNRDLFTASTEPYLSSTPFTSNAERYSPLPGLMVIHVRRGDYATHCRTLAMWSEDFVSVNAFPEMRDPFVVPPHEEWGNNTPENVEVYRRRCLPTIEEIVSKVAEVRAEPAARGVHRLYIMTNGDLEYIAELKDALHAAGDWEMISSSRDLVLSWEQKYVSHAVDLLVAQRAQVLLGNGFSTLTSNAVMMRLANGFPTDSTRFW
ncbi:hypothetical protein C8Q70DRAFT_911435 [Cubamyces menziesii]|nr:hypothetical protein C8Q70DRAFT_911435 [Cubamyces menziesii]